MSEAPERLDLAEDPMGGWWSAADAPPEARVAFVRADRYDEAVRQRDVAMKGLQAVVDATGNATPKDGPGGRFANILYRIASKAIAATEGAPNAEG